MWTCSASQLARETEARRVRAAGTSRHPQPGRAGALMSAFPAPTGGAGGEERPLTPEGSQAAGGDLTVLIK